MSSDDRHEWTPPPGGGWNCGRCGYIWSDYSIHFDVGLPRVRSAPVLESHVYVPPPDFQPDCSVCGLVENSPIHEVRSGPVSEPPAEVRHCGHYSPAHDDEICCRCGVVTIRRDPTRCPGAGSPDHDGQVSEGNAELADHIAIFDGEPATPDTAAIRAEFADSMCGETGCGESNCEVALIHRLCAAVDALRAERDHYRQTANFATKNVGDWQELEGERDALREAVQAACFHLTQGNPHLDRSRVFGEVAAGLRAALAGGE